jgi:hypothetical protein
MVLSSEPEASSLPSGDQAVDVTHLVWSLRMYRGTPLAEFHSRMVSSLELEAIRLPSGDQAVDMT